LNRLDEAPWHAADQDDQATKVVPVINENLFETKIMTKIDERDGQSVKETDSDGDEGRERKFRTLLWKKSKWFRYSLAFLIVFLVGFGSYQGVKIYLAAQNVEVPNVHNLPVEEASDILEELGLVVDASSERYHDQVEEGHIIRQNPVEGTKIPKGSTVRLTVSLGKPKIEMPSVLNLNEDQARTILKDFVITTEEQFHDSIPQGMVIAQTPQPNEMVAIDETKVHLVISKGKQTYQMPDLSGKSLEEARETLAQYHLGINEIKQGYSDQYGKGKIFDQWPYKPGDIVEKGELVDVWVSEGPEIKQKTRQITVQLDHGGNHPPGKGNGNKQSKEVHVEIIVKDINGERKVHDEKISQTKTYSVEVQVTPSQPAIILVYVNGEFYYDDQVHFDD
jgi:serine/threonine-protein kinase